MVSGFTPHWAWRTALAITGAALYVWAVRIGASALSGLVREGSIRKADLGRLILPAYIAGGVLMVAASVFNPIDPKLILLSGAAASFGSSCGLINIPTMVTESPAEQPPDFQTLPESRVWIIAAIPVAAVFVGILGPGIKLQ